MSLSVVYPGKQLPNIVHVQPYRPFPEGIRLLYATDFHFGQFGMDRSMADLQKFIMEQKADIILLGGDLAEGWKAQNRCAKDFLQYLKAPLGVYCVPGNNDREALRQEDDANRLWKDVKDIVHRILHVIGIRRNHPKEPPEVLQKDYALWREMLNDAGIRLLYNERVEIPIPSGEERKSSEEKYAEEKYAEEKSTEETSAEEKPVEEKPAGGYKRIVISGLDESKYGYPDMETVGLPLEDSDYHIVLTHSPWALRSALDRNRVDVALCGHTHGGQIALGDICAWAMGYAHAKKRKYFFMGGIRTFGETTAVVSNGIGYSLLPLRIKADPEIHILGK